MSARLCKLAILVGYKCNFRCSHCGVADKRKRELSDEEISDLRRLLAARKFESVLFIGGEPTLYIDKVNRVINGLPVNSKTKILITTNGHFAHSKEIAVNTLNRFERLDAVQLSYDCYHKQFLSLNKVANLFQACKSLDIGFVVLMAIKSPLDLILLNELKTVGITDKQVCVQGIHSIGSAATNNIEYKYPSFDPGVLKEKCPNENKIIYLCGEGYTTCCSQLTLGKDNSGYIHPTIREHASSKFYHLIRRLTFGKLWKKTGLPLKNIPAECSYPCTICGRIFAAIKKDKPKLLV